MRVMDEQTMFVKAVSEIIKYNWITVFQMVSATTTDKKDKQSSSSLYIKKSLIHYIYSTIL
jgi:hypothetical protein